MSDINNISQLLDGNNPHKQLLEQTRQLVDKWEPTGLLEGIDTETKRSGMAVLLENQANQLVNEAPQVGTASNNEQWSGVALPLVRRIFGELAAQDFVSVQPMNLPSGLIFYLDFRYGTDQSNFDSGQNVHGVTSASGDATEGLYGAGKFGYSINDTSVTINTGSYTTASVSFQDVDFEPSLSSSLTDLRKVTIAKTVLSGGDFDGVRAFEISGSGGSELDAFYPAHTKTSGANVVFIVDPTTPTGADAFGNKSVELVFKSGRGQMDETTGKVADEFYAVEKEPRGIRTGPDDYDIEIDEVGGNNIKDLSSDVSKLKEYATGKKPTIREMIQNKKRKDKAAKISEDPEARMDDVIRRQGEMLDDQDFASGGLAAMLGE